MNRVYNSKNSISLRKSGFFCALAVLVAASAVQGQTAPDRAAREAAFLASLPHDPPQSIDAALTAQYIHDNPGKEAIIRKVLAAEVACNAQGNVAVNGPMRQELAHLLSDDMLDRLTRLYSGPDRKRFEELNAKPEPTAEDIAEINSLYENYGLRDFIQIVRNNFRGYGTFSLLSFGFVQEACKESRDQAFDTAGITTLDDRLAAAVRSYTGEAGQFKTIEALLAQGARPHAPSKTQIALFATQGNSALTYAVSDGKADLVRLFLKQPTDLEAPVSDSKSLLVLAVAQVQELDTATLSAREDIVRQLIAAGAKVNAVDDWRDGPALLEAVQLDPDPVVVKMLLDAHADAQWKTSLGVTPLMGRAASQLGIAKLLIAAGTDPYAVSVNGSTALHFVCNRPASQNGQPDPAAAQRIALFLKPGETIDAHPVQQDPWEIGTPLLEAIDSENNDCIRALIAAGASFDAIAYPDSYIAYNPRVKGKTVRQAIRETVEKHGMLYSEPFKEFLKSMKLVD